MASPKEGKIPKKRQAKAVGGAKSAAPATKSLADGFKCLEWILAQRGPVALRDLAIGLGFEQTRAFRMAKTLLQAGLLQQTRGRKYEVGPAMYSLTAQTLQNSHLIEAALPPLEALRRGSSYRVALGTLWGKKVSYLYSGDKRTPIEKAIGGSPQWDATNSGLGLAALAAKNNEVVESAYQGEAIPNFPEGITSLIERLEEVRKLGYVYTSISGEGWQGAQYTVAIALPFNPTTAIGLAGRIGPGDVAELVAHLQRAAAEMERSLFHRDEIDPVKALRKIQLRGGV